MTMQKYELSAEQQEEVERFVAEESVNVAAAEARNKKRRPKDRKVSMNTIKEFIRENEWPRCDIAKDWLHSADPTQKVGLAAGMSMYRHDALAHMFESFKAEEMSETITGIRKMGYRLSEDGLPVMRYNALVFTIICGTYWTGPMGGPASDIGFWVRQWWVGIPVWRPSGPPVRSNDNDEEAE